MRIASSVILGFCLLVFAGCTQGQPGLAGGSTRDSGEIEIENSQASFQIIDGNLQRLIWKGIDSWNVDEMESGPEGERIQLKDGRTLEWEWKDHSDTLTVNGKQYSQKDGRLLLLSFEGDEVQVQQLKLDLSQMGSSSKEIRQSLIKLSEEDQVVRNFLDSIEITKPQQVEPE